MDTKIAYFVDRIEYAIRNHDYRDAKMYYDKAVLVVGNVEQVAAYQSTIENGLAKAKSTEQTSNNKKTRKKKPLNEAMIIIPIMLVLIVGYLIYYSINIYPEKHLREEISRTWYQGDVSGGLNSKGLSLNIGEKYDGTYEIVYSHARDGFIDKFKCEIISGEEITVDGNPIHVEIKDGLITFSPSFVDTSDRSVWRSSSYYSNVK